MVVSAHLAELHNLVAHRTGLIQAQGLEDIGSRLVAVAVASLAAEETAPARMVAEEAGSHHKEVVVVVVASLVVPSGVLVPMVAEEADNLDQAVADPVANPGRHKAAVDMGLKMDVSLFQFM